MSMRVSLLAAASVCLLTNCTPYQPIDRGEGTEDVAAPVGTDAGMETGTTAQIQDSPADGGAGQIDAGVAVIYKIRTKADIASSVTSMMTLADKNGDGQLAPEEFNIVSAGLAQEDNSITPSGEGGPVATPGAGENVETSTATPIRREEFFDETAGNDGQISAGELAAALNSRFDSSDEDSSGELTGEETSNFAASMLFSRE